MTIGPVAAAKTDEIGIKFQNQNAKLEWLENILFPASSRAYTS